MMHAWNSPASFRILGFTTPILFWRNGIIADFAQSKKLKDKASRLFVQFVDSDAKREYIFHVHRILILL